jgi:hypothetical protein
VRSKIEIQAERKRKKQRNLKENIQHENLTTSHRNFNLNFFSSPPPCGGGEPNINLLGLSKEENANLYFQLLFSLTCQ